VAPALTLSTPAHVNALSVSVVTRVKKTLMIAVSALVQMECVTMESTSTPVIVPVVGQVTIAISVSMIVIRHLV
jgi:hypothetical protein